jgi:hypothetical protein
MLWLKEEDYHAKESTRMVQGIMFIMPSRQRFIPYSWLLYSEVNDKQNELHFHYTHTVVIVTGTNLRGIHEAVVRYELYALREMPSRAWTKTNESTVTRIDIAEKVEN